MLTAGTSEKLTHGYGRTFDRESHEKQIENDICEYMILYSKANIDGDFIESKADNNIIIPHLKCKRMLYELQIFFDDINNIIYHIVTIFIYCSVEFVFVASTGVATSALWWACVAASALSLEGSHTAVCTICPRDRPPAASPIAT